MIQKYSLIRFGNLAFDNLWNRDFIDNIQITFAERLELKELVATMITGVLEIWCKNHTPSAFVSLLAMDKTSYLTKDMIRKQSI